MAEIIETANTAYEERDKANDQIEQLRNKAKREAKDFESDLKDISIIAQNHRTALDSVNKNNEKKNESMEAQKMSQNNDKMNKNKSTKGLKSQNIDTQLAEKHNRLKMDYAKIEAATRIKDFKKLTETFAEHETNNFEKFKYVIELSNQIEFLEHQIAEHKEEMKKNQDKGNNSSVAKYKQLKELDDQSLTYQKRSENFELKYNNSQKILNSIT